MARWQTGQVRLTRHERREIARAAWLRLRLRYERERQQLVEGFARVRARGVSVEQFVRDALLDDREIIAR